MPWREKKKTYYKKSCPAADKGPWVLDRTRGVKDAKTNEGKEVRAQTKYAEGENMDLRTRGNLIAPRT